MKLPKKIKNIYPYLFIMPMYLVVIIVYFYPLARVLRDSFYKIAAGTRTFIGFQNYIYLLFKEDRFLPTALKNNLILLTIIPIMLFLSLLIAYTFHEGLRGGKYYQAIIFSPKVISVVVVGMVFSLVLRADGFLNKILEIIHLDFLKQDWLGDYKIAIYSIMGIIIWKELGFGLIFFLAAMGSLDQNILDAAKVDGVNWFQMFIHIIIPQLKRVISFFIIVNITTVFAWIYPYVFTLTAGGPGGATTILEREILLWAFERRRFGMASALSVMLFVGIFVFVYIQSRLSLRVVED